MRSIFHLNSIAAGKRASWLQFLCYLTVSSLAALTNIMVGYALYGLLGLSTGPLYASAVAIGYMTGMAVNWSLNRIVTFPRSGRRKLDEFGTFVAVASVGLVLTRLYLQCDEMHIRKGGVWALWSAIGGRHLLEKNTSHDQTAPLKPDPDIRINSPFVPARKPRQHDRPVCGRCSHDERYRFKPCQL
jgi:putative flippase GtrA